MLKVIVTLFFGFFSIAEASRGVGNGGFGLECKGRKEIEVLDAYEARRFRPLELGTKEQSVEAKLNIVYRRLEKKSPYAAYNLSNRVRDFFRTRMYFKNTPPETNDMGKIEKPEACVLVQIVSQHAAAMPSGREYIIDSRLWDRLDNDNIVALALHEALFGIMSVTAKKENYTSKATRKIVAQLINGGIDDLNARQYDYFLRGLTEGNEELFSAVYFASVFGPDPIKVPVFVGDAEQLIKPLILKNSTFKEAVHVHGYGLALIINGEVEEGSISVMGNEISGFQISDGYFSYSEGYNFVYKLSTPKVFHLKNYNQSIVVKSVAVSRKTKDNENDIDVVLSAEHESIVTLKNRNGIVRLNSKEIVFRNGYLRTGVFSGNQTLQMKDGPVMFIGDNYNHTDFYPNGNVKAGTIAEDVTLPCKRSRRGAEEDSETLKLTKWTDVTFYESGALKSKEGYTTIRCDLNN